jgi:hypothetical protein
VLDQQQPALAAHAGTLTNMWLFAERDCQILAFHEYGVDQAVF